MKRFQVFVIAVGAALFFACGQSPVKASDTVDSLAAGKEAFEKKCKFCHSLSRALKGVRERDEWTQIIMRMVTYGAPLNSTERENVTSYLSARSSFEKKCNICHESTRVLSDPKLAKDWDQVLKKMQAHTAELAKKEQEIKEITAEELEEIAAFLTVVIPTE